jgi:16S rRNA G966 N2-methylase RsmD
MFTQAFYSALPAYLGGKRRLAPLILGILARHLPRDRWPESDFLDPMSGGGAVSLAAKAHGFRVTASDISKRGSITARALIANSTVKVGRDDIDRLLTAARTTETATSLTGRVEPLFNAARARPEPVASLLNLTLIKAYLRSFPMSMPSASDAGHFANGDLDRVSPHRLGHYIRGTRLFDVEHLWRIAQEVNAGVIGGRGEAGRGDALQILKNSNADVVYMDPPYPGTTGYDRPYRDLDRLLCDTGPRTPTPTLEELLAASEHIPLLILSYGGPGVDLNELIYTVSRYREPVESLRVPYPHLTSVATEERRKRNAEFIIIARR